MVARNQTSDGQRTSTRFEDTVSGDDLVAGDRIDKRLVAHTPGQYGTPWNRTAPDMKLVAVTHIDTSDDVYSALLADPDTGTLVRASRHSRQVARCQRELDWKVRATGTTVTVETIRELCLPDTDSPVEDEQAYVQEWASLLFDDARHGYHDYSDHRTLDGHALTLRDVDNRQAVAEISLE